AAVRNRTTDQSCRRRVDRRERADRTGRLSASIRSRKLPCPSLASARSSRLGQFHAPACPGAAYSRFAADITKGDRQSRARFGTLYQRASGRRRREFVQGSCPMTTSEISRVGFVGLGNIGKPMAERIAISPFALT